MDGALLIAVGLSATGSAVPAFILAAATLHFFGTDIGSRQKIWLLFAAFLSLPLFMFTAGLPAIGQSIALEGFGWLLFSVVSLPFATGFLIVGRGLHPFGIKDGLALVTSVAAAAIFCGYIFTR